MFGISEYKKCRKCDHRGKLDENFCVQCGTALDLFKPLPYSGEADTRGVYRITIIVEREFRNKDHAEEAAGKSCLGEDGGRFWDIPGKIIKSELVRSTVPPETHPYICGYCRDESPDAYQREHPPVTNNIETRCCDCGNTAWEPRGHPDGEGGRCIVALDGDECPRCGYQPGDA
jgi:hypothetical protein